MADEGLAIVLQNNQGNDMEVSNLSLQFNTLGQINYLSTGPDLNEQCQGGCQLIIRGEEMLESVCKARVISMAASSDHKRLTAVMDFTLIELIVGIVVFAIVLTIVTSVLAPKPSAAVLNLFIK